MKPKIIILTVIALAVFIAAGEYIDHRMNMDTGLDSLSLGSQSSPSPSSSPMASEPAAAPTENIQLQNLGKAPEFTGIDHWLNSNPLTMASLKGKVVLVDFWTYSCINCIRTLPYVTKWYDTYNKDGFVVVGVHTPEFSFEKDTNNVQAAIQRFSIHYPVAQDNEYGTWKAYGNEYWPAEYLIDKNGNIVYLHFGEGEYDHTENAIRELLGMKQTATPDNGADLSQVQSPEMYFGTDRLQNLIASQTPSTQSAYILPADVPLNNFALGGSWQFSPQNLQLVSGTGTIKLKFHSGKVYIVAASATPATLTITVDGKVQPAVVVQKSQLYTLFDSGNYVDHIIEIQANTPGFQAFTFTFG